MNEVNSNPDDVALHIVKEFGSIDRSSIRNVPSYLHGIAKRLSVRTGSHGAGGANAFGSGTINIILLYENCDGDIC
jgi:hypothetical protein